MFTRRGLLHSAVSAGAGLALGVPDMRWAAAQTSPSQLEHNKAVVRRFKESQGTKDEAEAMREVLSPTYKRWRGGMENLANNARDQDFPSAGTNLRGAFPDRKDVIEDVIAEGDMVGMLFRISGTHKGNFLGIPPTGKSFEIHEMGIFKLADGKIIEASFMADETGLLQQIGAKLPPRKDGQSIVPPLTGAGEDPDVVIKRLQAGPLTTKEDRNRLLIARSKGSAPFPKDEMTPDFRQTRVGFQHLREYGDKKGLTNQNITAAMPERNDKIDGFIAEGDKVWMRFKLSAVHSKPLYGLPGAGKRVEVPEIGVMRIVDGKWKESWYFGDELGLLLQLGIVDVLLS
jgi:steroid delta-isomerase-like uncharacterized protein